MCTYMSDANLLLNGISNIVADGGTSLCDSIEYATDRHSTILKMETITEMIQISDVRKKYGKMTILDGIDLHAECGEQIAVIGGNGSGKTTLLRIMSGIIKPDVGTLTYFGHDMLAERRQITKFCGYLPQENPLIPELSVQDNIRLWTGRFRSKDEKLIRLFELEDILKTRVSELSGGMKRRVSIACALATWPPIMIMDEPTTALDIYYKDSVHKLMNEYKKMNGILIISTHDKEEMDMSDHCLELKNGVFNKLK